MKELVKFSEQPELKSPSFIIGWNDDATGLGTKVTDYLNRKLGGHRFAEIEPVDFFSLEGVAIEDDLVQFPESTFYACPRNNLVIFKSAPPTYEWHKFLNLLLDVAQPYCQAKELYAIGSMVSLSAHTSPRPLLGVFNSLEFKNALSPFNFTDGFDYETPDGQRPTLNAFLLWAASRRNIPAVSLWLPIPFYLLGLNDPTAQKAILQFFNQRFNLHIDFTDLDEEINRQNQTITEIRSQFPDIDQSITKLEGNLSLSAEENQKLAEEMTKFLKGK